jgi:hypothetical protein
VGRVPQPLATIYLPLLESGDETRRSWPALPTASRTPGTASVGWLGAVAGFLVLALAGLAGTDAQTVRAAYISMEMWDGRARRGSASLSR